MAFNYKRVHIQRISELDSVRKRWQETHGRPPNDDDVSAMFAEFVPLQLECLSKYSALIPGTLEAVAELRRRGIKIGSTTGYLPEMMKINQADAKRQGYEPDATVCAGDVPAGRRAKGEARPRLRAHAAMRRTLHGGQHRRHHALHGRHPGAYPPRRNALSPAPTPP